MIKQLREIIVILPPIKEQRKIATTLIEKTDHIDELMKKTSEKVTLLEEYRRSLISSVVTGKVRVTEDEV